MRASAAHDIILDSARPAVREYPLMDAMMHPVVGCMACQIDRQGYGIETMPV